MSRCGGENLVLFLIKTSFRILLSMKLKKCMLFSLWPGTNCPMDWSAAHGLRITALDPKSWTKTLGPCFYLFSFFHFVILSGSKGLFVFSFVLLLIFHLCVEALKWCQRAQPLTHHLHTCSLCSCFTTCFSMGRACPPPPPFSPMSHVVLATVKLLGLWQSLHDLCWMLCGSHSFVCTVWLDQENDERSVKEKQRLSKY